MAPPSLRQYLAVALTSFVTSRVNGECVNYFGEGYFSNKQFRSGLPSSTYVQQPVDSDGQPAVTACELEELHEYCVERINQYRSGVLKFSDGSTDTNVASGLQPMSQATGAQRCASESAMGDLVAQNGQRGCGGAHDNAFTCGFRGYQAQNSCCGYGNARSVAGIKARLDQCLQSMWDEGITPGQKGHWETMRSKRYSQVACGFAFTRSGLLFMNQDFGSAEPSGAAGSSSDVGLTCSCSGKAAGASDGCGGTCVSRSGGPPPTTHSHAPHSHTPHSHAPHSHAPHSHNPHSHTAPTDSPKPPGDAPTSSDPPTIPPSVRSTPPPGTSLVIEEDFSDPQSVEMRWIVVDSGTKRAPSEWRVNAEGNFVEQISNIRTKEPSSVLSKLGTEIVWLGGLLGEYEDTTTFPDKFSLGVKCRSADNDLLGFAVHRSQSGDEQLRLSFAQRHGSPPTRLVRFRKGEAPILVGSATWRYTRNDWFDVEMQVSSNKVHVYVNGDRIIEAILDSPLSNTGGTIALYSFANRGSAFAHLRVGEIDALDGAVYEPPPATSMMVREALVDDGTFGDEDEDEVSGEDGAGGLSIATKAGIGVAAAVGLAAVAVLTVRARRAKSGKSAAAASEHNAIAGLTPSAEMWTFHPHLAPKQQGHVSLA